MASCSSNNSNIETAYVESIDDQQNLRITFQNETSIIFKAYKFDLETKQWEVLLTTNQTISWKEDSYIIIFNPKNDEGLCLKMDNKNGISEKYGYDNDYYDNIISNEADFMWYFNENIILEKNEEIPIAFGVFKNDDENEEIDFDSLTKENISYIDNNMIMFTIVKK